jgi:hypothetical protein
MNDEHMPGRSSRENVLAIALAVIIGSGFLVFLLIVTGGLLLQILAAIIILGSLGWLHFLLWGRSFKDQTAGEREEAELRDKLETKEWDLPGPRHPRND